MGFFNRLKNASDVARGGASALRFSAPSRLRVPVSLEGLGGFDQAKLAEEGPALLIHVIDPSLVLTEAWKSVLALGEGAQGATSNQAFDSEGLAAPVRRQVADDSFFAAAVDQLTDDFAHSWFSAGVGICQAESASGIVIRSGVVSSATSSALTIATIDLETDAAVLLAQQFVRDGYLAERIKTGGPSAAHLDFNTFVPDYRLAVFRRPFGISMDQIEAWVDRFPLPSANRDAWVNALMNHVGDEEAFTSTVLEAIRAFRQLGAKAHSASL